MMSAAAGSLPSWAQLERLARKRFDVTQWRPGQREIMEATSRGEDVLGILPTGAGKSLCFPRAGMKKVHPSFLRKAAPVPGVSQSAA